ncbi:hypothetical protein LEP1GSC185_3453 [Leptospira licerasiae serovar Varillal str. VAR 010]|uniref:Serine protease n=2 Tax=Leptospiraceae TaxID=170 RepID=A0ABN0HAH0_9LEPT|nr:hypothetical protein [Leptospira venezuelensis]EIE01400.1 hypothetical protein LEP1GSC185_3453 [Leptospira licerasiae serovar Varillal str. VAR 010]EJZ42608.1 hypothetical protein LEP1GSC178_3066 [Leptospira licerasiae str. MMD4847]
MSNSNELLSMRQYVADITKQGVFEINKFTMPLFYMNDKGYVDLASTSLLFSHNDRYFVITTAHTLEWYNENLFFYYKDDVNLPLDGNWRIFKTAGSKDIGESRIDLGIIEIDSEVLKKIYEIYEFMKIDNIDFNPAIEKPQTYFLYGYPNSNTKIDKRTREIKSKPFIFTNPEHKDKSLYDKLGIHRNSHLLVEYDREQVIDPAIGIVTGKFPRGCSGCGLWLIPKVFYKIKEPVVPRLSGVLIEYYENSLNALVTLRANLVLEVFKVKLGMEFDFEINSLIRLI